MPRKRDRHPDLGARLQHGGADRSREARADYPAEIVLVISNGPDAAGLRARAQAAGIATAVIDHRAFRARIARPSSARSTPRFDASGIELVCLAGFMRMLDARLRRALARAAAQHPPFPAARVQGPRTPMRARSPKACASRRSVHFVTDELDDGPIIAQAAVPVLPGDTEKHSRAASSTSKAPSTSPPCASSPLARPGSRLAASPSETKDLADFRERAPSARETRRRPEPNIARVVRDHALPAARRDAL